jgi:hypothetical protein
MAQGWNLIATDDATPSHHFGQEIPSPTILPLGTRIGTMDPPIVIPDIVSVRVSPTLAVGERVAGVSPFSRNEAYEFSPEHCRHHGSVEEERPEVVSCHHMRVKVEYHLAASSVYIDKKTVP